MDIKLAIGDPKTAKVHKREIKEEDAKALYGKKLGDKIRGELFGMNGYEFQITGGSDYCGFPMRKDVVGTARKKILIVAGQVGTRHTRDGLRKRRSVCGNTIYAKTAQLNLKVLQHGSEPLAAPEGTEEKKAE